MFHVEHFGPACSLAIAAQQTTAAHCSIRSFLTSKYPQTTPPSPVHAKDVRQSLRTDTRSVDHPHVSLDSRIALERWQVGTPNRVARLHLVGFIPHPVPDIAEFLIFFVATLSLSQSGCHFYLVAKS